MAKARIADLQKERAARDLSKAAQEMAGAGNGLPAARVSLYLPGELADRARNAAFWTPGLTLSALVAAGLERELKRLEKANGGPFAAREGKLPRGRPS